jgi:hypothetical protein
VLTATVDSGMCCAALASDPAKLHAQKAKEQAEVADLRAKYVRWTAGDLFPPTVRKSTHPGGNLG